ncbi:MAG: hypothetical protein IPO69_04580 [Saprospiraceae bacterium]|nr:hypothetical protein [Saprospiraceae bacterium]
MLEGCIKTYFKSITWIKWGRGEGLIDTAPIAQSLDAIVKLDVTDTAPGSVAAAPDITSCTSSKIEVWFEPPGVGSIDPPWSKAKIVYNNSPVAEVKLLEIFVPEILFVDWKEPNGVV